MIDVILGDLHLDTKSGDVNYLTYQQTFFSTLLEYLDSETVRHIILLGDIFTNQNTIDVNVSDYSLKLMENLSKKCEKIIMIKGNHDKYFRNSYAINSVDVVFKDRYDIDLFDTYSVEDNYLFLNWRDSSEEYIDVFKSIKNPENIEYIFGHFEICGYYFNRLSVNKNEKNIKEEVFKKYFPNLKKVYSGHYHTPQHESFINYVGIPYELDWSTFGLKLGFFSRNVETNKTKFLTNKEKIYIYLKFTTEDEIKSFEIVEKPYKQYYKIEYNDKNLETAIHDLKEMLEKNNNNVTLLAKYSLTKDIDKKDLEEVTKHLEENASGENKKYTGKFDFTYILKYYIDNILECDRKDEVYSNTLELYEECKKNININNEL